MSWKKVIKKYGRHPNCIKLNDKTHSMYLPKYVVGLFYEPLDGLYVDFYVDGDTFAIAPNRRTGTHRITMGNRTAQIGARALYRELELVGEQYYRVTKNNDGWLICTPVEED